MYASSIGLVKDGTSAFWPVPGVASYMTLTSLVITWLLLLLPNVAAGHRVDDVALREGEHD